MTKDYNSFEDSILNNPEERKKFLSNIVGKSNILLEKLSDEKIDKIKDDSIKLKAKEFKKVVTEFSHAANWKDEEIRTNIAYVEGLQMGMQLVSDLKPCTPEQQSCTNNCKHELDDCLRHDCGPGEVPFPCYCCVTCRLGYVACIIDCISD